MARQIAVYGSRPADHPCTTGMMMTPNRMPTRTIPIIEIVAQIRELLETRIRPAVAGDGGDIQYRGFREGVVYLTMQGACSGCPSSTATLKHGIEGLLKHYVPEVTEVRAA